MRIVSGSLAALLMVVFVCGSAFCDELTDTEKAAIGRLEQQRIEAIEKVVDSVVAIYGNDRAGGGSGVIIHPSGIALTNHHVIIGAGVEGFGGISDGKLYKWKLIGTDPGGDVSIIQMEGRDDFPWSPLGDSDTVRVGDWALAMGNPFVLTEDQVPTVTLGIVSGVKRYQPGSGQNQLEYGNCIQVDSSINPGNSGGPLFNFNGEVIGINGRGSFQDRGRVNVGLGYAISANQIRNFVPELLATKLVEHATLDANFSDRDGKVVCSTVNLDAPIATSGLKLGDELLEFEGVPIKTANQFTNLICTVPENWPVSLRVRSAEDGSEKDIRVRAFGLPYAKPKQRKRRKPPGGGEPSEEEKDQDRKNQEMIKLLSAPPGEVRHADINETYTKTVLKEWKGHSLDDQKDDSKSSFHFDCAVHKTDGDRRRRVGDVGVTVLDDGRFVAHWNDLDGKAIYVFNGDDFYASTDDKEYKKLTLVEAKTTLPILLAYGVASPLRPEPFAEFGTVLIDGSDRSAGALSWRFSIEDRDEDTMYAWTELTCGSGVSDMSGLLQKMAPHADCRADGGVIFKDFTGVAGLKVPSRFLFVEGLDEIMTHELERDSIRKIASDSKDARAFKRILDELN